MRTKALGSKLVAAVASVPTKSDGTLKASIRPPPAAAPATRNVLRESLGASAALSGPRSKIISPSPFRGDFGLGGLLDRLPNADIGDAAADVARHRRIDVVVGRIGVAGEQI